MLYLLSLEGLQKSIQLLDEIFTCFGLAINNSKTETMILNVDEIPTSIANLRGSKMSPYFDTLELTLIATSLVQETVI